MASIDRGRPVVLGLVVARSLGAIGDNHQVVAYGYEKSTDGDVVVTVYDNNSPGRAVTLTSSADQHEWTASNGHVWRGFFVQDYTPKSPRVLTRRPPDPAEPVSTGLRSALARVYRAELHSHALPYTHPGRTVSSRSRASGVPTTTTVGGSSARPTAFRSPTGRSSGCATSRPVAGGTARVACRRRSPKRRRLARSTTGPGHLPCQLSIGAVARRWAHPARPRPVGHLPALASRLRPAVHLRPAGGQHCPDEGRRLLVDDLCSPLTDAYVSVPVSGGRSWGPNEASGSVRRPRGRRRSSRSSRA